MQPKSPAEYTVLSLRVVVGVWFFLLGAEKIFRVGVVPFSRQVAEFRILMDPWNLMVAYGVVWLEFVAGLCLITGWLRRGASRAVAGLTLLFLFANGQAMVRGFEPDCGCFGEMFELGQPAKMWLLVGQLALVAVVIVTERIGTRKVFAGSQLQLPG